MKYIRTKGARCVLLIVPPHNKDKYPFFTLILEISVYACLRGEHITSNDELISMPGLVFSIFDTVVISEFWYRRRFGDPFKPLINGREKKVVYTDFKAHVNN